MYHLNHFKVDSSVALSTFALSCSHPCCPFTNVHFPKLKLCTRETITPRSPDNHQSTFYFYDFD